MSEIVQNQYSSWQAENSAKFIYNGFIFVGQVDTDPEIKANQIRVYYIDENEQEVNLTQPIRTNSSGFPVISETNSTVIQVKTESDYSVKVLNKGGSQEWYIPKASTLSPVIPADAISTEQGNSVQDYINLNPTPFKTVADLKIQKDAGGNTVNLNKMIGSYVNILEYTAGVNESDLEGWIRSGSHTEDGGSIITISGDLYLEVNVKRVDAKRWGLIGGCLVSRLTAQAQKQDLSLRNIRSTSFVNEKEKLQKMLNYAKGKFQTVFLNDLDVAVDISDNVPVYIPSTVTLDLEGGYIVRFGTENGNPGVGGGGTPMFRNENFGAPATSPADYDTDMGIVNGYLVGNYDENGASDQGSAVTFWKAYNVSFDNLVTMDTEGDGILLRDVEASVNNIKIGNFGRNGISPTDGVFNYYDIEVYGQPLPNADPGIAIDCESELGGFRIKSNHNFVNVKARELYLVDFYSSEDEDFKIAATLTNCELGVNAVNVGSFRPLYIRSGTKTKNADVTIDETTRMSTQGTRGAGAYIFNVSGVNFGAATVKGLTGSNLAGVEIEGEVDALNIDGLITDGNIPVDFRCENEIINNAVVRFGSQSNVSVFLTGSNNKFSAPKFSNLSFFGTPSTTTGNIFDGSIPQSLTLFDTATLDGQTIPAKRESTLGLSGQNESIYTKEVSIVGAATESVTIKTPVGHRVFKLVVSVGSSSNHYAYKELVLLRDSTGANIVLSTPVSEDSGTASISVTGSTTDSITLDVQANFGGVCNITLIG